MEATCLCALWCDSCEAYREGFFAMAQEFPRARFRWLDIEEHEHLKRLLRSLETG